MQDFSVKTRAARQVVDLTAEVQERIREVGFSNGLANIFVAHTTAAISTADLDPGTDLDMLDAFSAMVPPLRYRHPHDPAHAPDHILATLVGPSVTVPVREGRLVLGTWQRVVLFEFDGPRTRSVTLSLVG